MDLRFFGNIQTCEKEAYVYLYLQGVVEKKKGCVILGSIAGFISLCVFFSMVLFNFSTSTLKEAAME